MNLLAIECSTDACSVALKTGADLLTDHRLVPQQQATLVLPMVDGLLAEAGITPSQLDGIVYGQGPGSFTGVRIAVALSQGIALGADAGVVGVSTLQTIAQGCFRDFGDSRVVVSLDARMSEIYLGAYVESPGGIMQAVVAERVCSPDALGGFAESKSDPSVVQDWRWAGSGAERYADILSAGSGVDSAFMRKSCWPFAQDLLTIGFHKIQATGLNPPEEAIPVYLRDKVARTMQEQALARQG